MKIINILLLLLFIPMASVAQEEIVEVEEPQTDEPVHMAIVESFPRSKDCLEVENDKHGQNLQNCLNKYMQGVVMKNFQFPKLAQEEGVQGKIYVRFIIEKDGSISNLEIVRGILDNYQDGSDAREAARQLEQEALRVIKLFEIVEPATQRGKPVRVTFLFPIAAMLG